MASNMVYKLENNSLVPYQEFWGGQPRHEMLKKEQVSDVYMEEEGSGLSRHEMLKKDQVSDVYMEGEGWGSIPARDAKKRPGK